MTTIVEGRILVVEDNPLNLKLVRDVLRAAGFEVIVAVTGEDGVARARDSAPDLILMDIQLPGMDGYEALRTIREDPRTQGITVVALTAFAMKADRVRGLRDGFDDYIEKPISIRTLPARVSGYLSERHVER